MRWCVLIVIFAACGPASALGEGECGFACGDLDGDGAIGPADYEMFTGCLDSLMSAGECLCADLDGNSRVDLRDFALQSRVFGRVSDELPPACTGMVGSIASLTAYRPQHGSGYFPFARTAVAEDDEADAMFGPGIRLNGGVNTDPAGEDDLIEVVVHVDPPGAALALRRSDERIAIWTTRDRLAGTEVVFAGDRSAALPLGPGESTLTLWAEWDAITHGTGALTLEPLGAALAKDVLVFHTFQSIVIALGGEGQTPTLPTDPNMGTFVVGTALYGLGYDVHLFDEDVVSASGSGLAYDAAADAIMNRAVGEVAIFGYSHGGGSTYDLADLLDVNRAGLGLFDITYTAYTDSVSNNSDVDTSMELRRPPGTGLHVNHYQHGTLFEDFFLDGGPVADSLPPPTGLDVETTPWGAGSTHFEVDDFPQVRTFMQAEFVAEVNR